MTPFIPRFKQNGYAFGAEVDVASGMIKMPMCTHQPCDGAHRRFEDRVVQFSNSRIQSAIDQQSAAIINDSRNVSSVPGKGE